MSSLLLPAVLLLAWHWLGVWWTRAFHHQQVAATDGIRRGLYVCQGAVTPCMHVCSLITTGLVSVGYCLHTVWLLAVTCFVSLTWCATYYNKCEACHTLSSSKWFYHTWVWCNIFPITMVTMCIKCFVCNIIVYQYVLGMYMFLALMVPLDFSGLPQGLGNCGASWRHGQGMQLHMCIQLSFFVLYVRIYYVCMVWIILPPCQPFRSLSTSGSDSIDNEA